MIKQGNYLHFVSESLQSVKFVKSSGFILKCTELIS